MDILIHVIVKVVGFMLVFGVIALLVKVISGMLPDKYRDGNIAPLKPETKEKTEPDYITELNKRLDAAGVETERDLLQ